MQPGDDAPRGGFASLQRKAWIPVFWAALIVLSVAVTQLSKGAYQSDLATHPDEAAYFVSATCLLDYFRTAFGSDPVSFAESCYVHYPKVAFGHWPPAFFGIQALWYWIVGATVPAGILLVGLIAAITAFVLFVSLRRFYGTWIAGLSVAVYFSLPVVRSSSSILLPDMLAALFSLLAILAFCDGCVAPTRRPWIACGFYGAMAILTKESALALFVFAPAAFILLGGETRRKPRIIWHFGAVCCLLALLLLAIYQFTGVLRLRGVPSVTNLARVWEGVQFLTTFLHMVPWLVFALAGLGALYGTVSDQGANRMAVVYVRGAILWLFVWLACQAISRDVIEERYFLPAVFPLIILFAAGLDRVSRLLPSRADGFAIPGWAMLAARIVPTIVAVLCIVSMPAITSGHRAGYAQVAASLPVTGDVILVSSDTSGEGAMVVECLVRDDARNRIVLRGSKMLASSGWMGGHYRPLTTSVAEVRDLLNAIPVQFIVLDASGFIDEGMRSSHRLLEQTMTEESSQFRLVADFPLFLENRRQDGAIQVYENLKARGRRPDVIRVPMTETLGRTLELHIDNGSILDIGKAARGRRETNTGASIRDFANAINTLLPNRGRASWRFRIRPAGDDVGAAGGPGVISVTADTGHEWAAHTTAGWVTIKSGASGSGNGVVRYEIAQNDSSHARSGEIAIGEARYSVRQSAPP
jgi:4-amino-4-deoxy-L-arabinose transferase-like glycosyltransferase